VTRDSLMTRVSSSKVKALGGRGTRSPLGGCEVGFASPGFWETVVRAWEESWVAVGGCEVDGADT